MRILKTHTLTRPANNYVIDAPQPSNINYWWNVGSLLGVSLIIQIITGVTLAMHYNASVLEAFNSVEHIMRDVNNGWLIRYLHANTASAFFFLVYLHIGRGLYYGSYKAPRTLTWTIGTIMLILMMATAFLGYVLPYGQMSLWGATVITNLLSAIPWIGQDIVEFVWGGFSVNNATLNRFFSLHFVLPFVLAALVLMHLIALHDTAGANNPLGISGNYDRIPFAPYFVFKDFITLFIFMLVLSIFVFFVPNVLGDSENYVMANPMQTPPAIVPEWYLLPFYAILRSIPNKLVGVIAMFSAILIILSLTIGDVSKLRGSQFKPLLKGLFFLFIGNLLLLLVLGAKHVESPFIEAGQIATLIYFVYFGVIVPISAIFENSVNETYTTIRSMLFNFKERLNTPSPNPFKGSIGLESNLGLPRSNGNGGSGGNGAPNGGPNRGGNGNFPYRIPTIEQLRTPRNIPNVVPDGYGRDQMNPAQYREMMREEAAANEVRRSMGLNPTRNNGLTGLWNQDYIDSLNASRNPNNAEASFAEIPNQNPDQNPNQNDGGRNSDPNNRNQNGNTEEKNGDTIGKSLKRKRDDDDNEPKGPNGGGSSSGGSGNNAGGSNGSGNQAARLLDNESIIILFSSISLFIVLTVSVYTLIDSVIVIKTILNIIKNLVSTKYLLNDAPTPWGLYFQDTASPQMEALTELHDSIMFYLVIILFAVGWILAAACVKYVKSGISNKFISHGSLVEIIWTVSPGLILIFIAFTSFKLLYLMDEVSDVNMSLYIEGHQWYWSYQYPDFLDDDGEFIEYDSYLTPESDLEPGAMRMLDVDERVILPELTHVRFIVSSGDVIHSYASPSLGLKADAYPGRLNQASALINRLGTFYGQCSEICGILHSSMPIAIESVTLEKFLLFLWEK